MAIKINKKIIFSYFKPPIIIAEISGNHNGNKKRFIKLIKQAYDNGADIVKIQTYEPKDITLPTKNNKYLIKKGSFKGSYLWNIYKKAQTPFSWHKAAFNYAKKRGKIIFSTPFSIRAVDLLEKLKVKIYKISSFEITDVNLIKYIAQKKKPIIISTGMCTIKDLNNAINIITKYHNKIIILHCVSGYPTKLSETNLKRINFLKNKYSKYLTGLSDHTNDITSSIAATCLGIVVIEKHFKGNFNFKTVDSDFSISSQNLKKLKEIVCDLHISLNKLNKKNNSSSKFKNLKRSIFANQDIKSGEVFNENNISSLRPKIGICASKYFKIIGKKAKKNLKKTEPIYMKNVNL